MGYSICERADHEVPTQIDTLGHISRMPSTCMPKQAPHIFMVEHVELSKIHPKAMEDVEQTFLPIIITSYNMRTLTIFSPVAECS